MFHHTFCTVCKFYCSECIIWKFQLLQIEFKMPLPSFNPLHSHMYQMWTQLLKKYSVHTNIFNTCIKVASFLSTDKSKQMLYD